MGYEEAQVWSIIISLFLICKCLPFQLFPDLNYRYVRLIWVLTRFTYEISPNVDNFFQEFCAGSGGVVDAAKDAGHLHFLQSFATKHCT